MDNPNDVPVQLSPIADEKLTVQQKIDKQNQAPIYQDIEPIATGQGPKGAPPTAEIATVRRNIFIPPTYYWVLRPRDATLRAKGGGWDYEIYYEAEADPKIYSTLQKRKGALLAYPVKFTAASDKPQDIAAKELAERAIKSFNFARFVKGMLDAVGKGFSVAEVMWDLVDGPIGKEWHVVETYKRDQRRFRFDEFNRLRLLDWDNLILGELLPDRKFIVHTFEPEDGDPYGRGLGRILWWNAWFKRQNQEAWLIHNEKFASPTVQGSYPPDASDEEQDEVWAAARSFSTDSAIVTPQGTEFKLIETARGAGADTFNVMREAQNEDIDMVVLGSTYAANAGGLDGGSGADTDQDDRLELAQADGNDLAMVLNRTLIKWIVEVNLPGARPPTMEWMVDAEEDLSERAKRDGEIESMGFEPSEEYINATYGGEWTKKAVLAPVITDEANFAQPAAGAPTNRIAGKLTAQLADEADPVISAWVGEFRKVIETSTTLEEAQDRLVDLYGMMDGSHFAQTMEAALRIADLVGRVDTRHGG